VDRRARLLLACGGRSYVSLLELHLLHQLHLPFIGNTAA
jgi:hypothetical protein